MYKISILYIKYLFHLYHCNFRFFVNTGFPGTIGAIDKTHIAIFSPETIREHLIINRKMYHSLNVMIVSKSATYKIICFNILNKKNNKIT